MSKFNMSPSGLKPVGSQHETTFTKMLKSSNDVSQKQGGAAKQTKFTEYITSSNQHRSEIEKQKETIANLNAQINELTEREDDVSVFNMIPLLILLFDAEMFHYFLLAFRWHQRKRNILSCQVNLM